MLASYIAPSPYWWFVNLVALGLVVAFIVWKVRGR